MPNLESHPFCVNASNRLRFVIHRLDGLFAWLFIFIFLNAQAALPVENRTYDLAGSLISRDAEHSTTLSLIGIATTYLTQTNGSIYLSATISGNVPFEVQWFRGTNLIVGATNISFAKDAMIPVDAGDYRAVISTVSGMFTSAVSRVDFDADRDGMGDNWERANFGNLTSSDGQIDFDGDGVPDRQEFEDGTNPRSRLSVRPRVNVVAFGGNATVSPVKSSYDYGERVTLTASPPDRFVGWFGQVAGSSNPIVAVVTNGKPIIALFGTIPISIDAAVGLPTGSLRNGGDIGWFPQNAVTKDGSDALQSGPITHLQRSSIVLFTNLAQPSYLRFWATVSANTYFTSRDVLRVTHNSLVATNIDAGNIINQSLPWTQYSLPLPSGTNTIEWAYVKNFADDDYYSVGDDAARLDLVTFEPITDPTIDTDADGLPDLWELTYLRGLSQGPNNDFDSDGVSNGQELADGTNPSDRNSFFARLTTISFGGTIFVEPLQERYTNGQTVQVSVTPSNNNVFIEWTGALSGTNPVNTLVMRGNRTVIAMSGLALAQATDQPGRIFSARVNSYASWFGQTNISHDGNSAAQSGPIKGSGFSAMRLTVKSTEPQIVRFWWRVSSATGNLLQFSINGLTWSTISGQADWQQVASFLPVMTGTQDTSLEWRYTKNSTNIAGFDAGWVDQITFEPAPRPTISHESITVSNGVITAILVGDPMLSYKLEQSQDLIYWSDTFSSFSGSNGVWRFSDSATAPRRFYRVRLLP